MNINANFQSFPSSLDRLPFWAAPVQYAPKETLLASIFHLIQFFPALFARAFCFILQVIAGSGIPRLQIPQLS